VTINIADIFVKTARQKGSETAIIEAESGRKISFAALNKKSDEYAFYLRKHGVCPGNIVMLMVKPSAEFVILTLTLFKIGAPIVLIDPGMGFKNLLRCISRVRPQYLIGIPRVIIFAKLFGKHFKSVHHIFCCGNSWGLLGKNMCKQSSAPSSFKVYQPKDDDIAAIIFTTGSTGPPKGVRYEHGIFAAQLRLIKDYYGISARDTDQPAFPLFALFSTAIGACTVIPDMDSTKPAKVNPEKFINSIIEYNVSYSFGSPAIWNVVSRYCIKKKIVLESVEKILMAGAPVPYDLIKRVSSILPENALIYTPYGATESLPIVSIEAKEILNSTWQLSRKGYGTCVGYPLPGIEIKIISINDSEISEFKEELQVAAGEKGEIIVRGDVVTRAYENNPDETKLSKIRDGESFWHRMGDVGYLDSQKRLWFCGRKAHRVVTAAGTLFSVPCEAIINEHPHVLRSALVGVKKKMNDEYAQPVLIVEPLHDRKIDKELLLSQISELARVNPITMGVEYFLIHNNFPVDIRHNAKIFREKLAIWAQKKIFPL